MQAKTKTSFLILGAGWTSTFLIPLLEQKKVDYAATTTTGRDHTIQFKFEADSKDSSSFKVLPEAKTVLIAFPLRGIGQSKKLLQFYHDTHTAKPHYILLGSTGIWPSVGQAGWITRNTSHDPENQRAVAEDEIITLGGCVLNLSGLWGNGRSPKRFLRRAVTSKAQLKSKRSLHMIHGQDVARAIHAVFKAWPGPSRWLLTDQLVYDWYELFAAWGSEGADESHPDAGGEALTWVRELMKEEGIRALPRSMEALGRTCDSTEFWQRFNLSPVRARL